ncbi:MAG: pyridoxamine 5'-phosphate oxidase family protein [Candidatus Bathyarchaeota archaeon]
MDGKLVDEAYSHLGLTTTSFVATSVEGQPHVRAMMLIKRSGGFYYTTGTRDAKVQEMVMNPRVEVCIPVGDAGKEGSVRLTGSVEFVYDEDVKAEIFGCVGFAEAFWGQPENPEFTLLKFKPVRLQYMRHGTMEILSAEL